MERVRSKKWVSKGDPTPRPQHHAKPKVSTAAPTLDCSASSNLESAAYYEPTKELRVKFKNGTIYSYDGVSAEHWEGFRLADSKGKYLAAEIKPNYPAKKLEAV